MVTLYDYHSTGRGEYKGLFTSSDIFFFVICEKIHDRSCMKFVDFSTLQVEIYTI